MWNHIAQTEAKERTRGFTRSLTVKQLTDDHLDDEGAHSVDPRKRVASRRRCDSRENFVAAGARWNSCARIPPPFLRKSLKPPVESRWCRGRRKKTRKTRVLRTRGPSPSYRERDVSSDARASMRLRRVIHGSAETATDLPCESAAEQLTCSLLSRWPVTDTLDPPRALAHPMLRIPGGRSRAGPRTRTRTPVHPRAPLAHPDVQR